MGGTWPLVGRREELGAIGAALTDPSIRCVLLSGPAGVGKTRLAREAAAEAKRRRWNVQWAIATEQTRAVPLAAVAPLLPALPAESGADRHLHLLRWARRCLVRTGAAPSLLLIDDVPLLDDLTAALVQQLARSEGPLRLVLTARSGEAPRWLDDLARDDAVRRVWVEALTEPAAATLTETVLGGAVDAATQAQLWQHSSGNPLWLRQLVDQGVDDGALRCREQVWTWHGPIAGRGLRPLLAERLERLPAAQLRALELVAVGEPLPLAVARALDVEEQALGLAQHGLVEQDTARCLRVAHPMYGSVTRAGLSNFTRRSLERRLADAFTACGALSESDEMRVARWRLDDGDASDGALMLAAAQRALVLDARLAERFARAACGTHASYEALHALGRALFDQGRSAEADEVYQQILSRPLNVEERLSVTMETAMSRAWVSHDAAGAIAMLREAEADEALALHHSMIAGMCAAVELFRGAPAAALDDALPVATDASVDVRVRVLAALAAVPALTLTGRVEAALELIAWARAAAPPQEFAGTLSYGPTYADAQLAWEHAFALRWAGQVDAAVHIASVSLQRVALEAPGHTQSYGLLNAAVGGARLAAGNVAGALGPLRTAASALRASDVTGMVVACLADLARAEALAGDVRAAESLLHEADERMTEATCAFGPSVARARAVTAAMAGDLPRARDAACAGADRARDASEPVLEAACLHLVARFDDAASVQARLAGLADASDAELVSMFASHARSLVDDDGAGLEAAAERFAAAGALMLAAQAAASAARSYRRAGSAAAATRMAQLSRSLSDRCPGAPVPLLLVEPVPLTARERDVVALVRRGMSNRQIAEALFVSVRTVESHLQHAYGKLGVRSRGELIAQAGDDRASEATPA